MIDLLFRSWAGLLIHIVVAGLLGYFILQNFFDNTLAEITKHGEVVTVPNLENLTPEEAEKRLTALNLRLAFRDTVYSEKHKPGAIITQNPVKGTEVKDQRRIYATVNESDIPTVLITRELYRKITRNDVNGIKVQLRSVGLKFKIDSTTNPYKDFVLNTLFEGKTIKQGQEIEKGSTIQLIVGNGKKEEDDFDAH